MCTIHVKNLPNRESVMFVCVDYHVDALKDELKDIEEVASSACELRDYDSFFVERNCFHELWNVWGVFGMPPDVQAYADPIIRHGELTAFMSRGDTNA